MIEVKGLTKRYGDLHALDDVSFTVEKGTIVGFLGANGAGKTTTMDIICGCIGADAGVAKVAGFDITESPIEAKRRLGYLPDVSPLYPDMRVREHIEYAARLNGVSRAELKTRTEKAMERLSISDVAHRLVGNLSKGYRQRVALAQAIVHDPDVLVLDEPTEGLDPNQIKQIRTLIRDLAGDHTIILSSHILSEVQNTCDRLIVIHQGKIVQQGTYEELVQSMESGNIYRLRVARNIEGAVSALSGVGGVSKAHAIDDLEIEFGLGASVSDDAIDTVAKKIVDGGFGLRELSMKKTSLEDVFIHLTH